MLSGKDLNQEREMCKGVKETSLKTGAGSPERGSSQAHTTPGSQHNQQEEENSYLDKRGHFHRIILSPALTKEELSPCPSIPH